MNLELEVMTFMSSLITLVCAISDSASQRADFEEIDNVEEIYFLNKIIMLLLRWAKFKPLR